MTRHAAARRPSYINRQKRKSDAEVVQLPYNILHLISIFEISGKESYRVSSWQTLVSIRN